MAARFLSLLLVLPLAWLSSAGTIRRADRSETHTWDAALARPGVPARVADVQSLLRTFAARPAGRRHAPPDHGPAPALHPAHASTTLARSACRTAELASSGCSAREPAFPYDATAPPAHA